MISWTNQIDHNKAIKETRTKAANFMMLAEAGAGTGAGAGVASAGGAGSGASSPSHFMSAIFQVSPAEVLHPQFGGIFPSSKQAMQDLAH